MSQGTRHQLAPTHLAAATKSTTAAHALRADRRRDALERQQGEWSSSTSSTLVTAYSPVVRRLYTVQADPEPMSARLVRGGLALACIPNA